MCYVSLFFPSIEASHFSPPFVTPLIFSLSAGDWVRVVAFLTENKVAEHAKTRQGLAGVGVRACTVLSHFNQNGVF